MTEPAQTSRAGLSFLSALPSTPTTMRLTGELDLATAAAVEAALRAACRPHTAVVVDLSELEFCDAAGIRTLLRVAQHNHDVDAQFSLAAARGITAKIFTLTGLSEAVTVYDSLADAINAHQPEPEITPSAAA